MKFNVDGKALSEAMSWGLKGANRSGSSSDATSMLMVNIHDSILEFSSFNANGFFSAKVNVLRVVDDNNTDDVSLSLLASQVGSLPSIVKNGNVTINIENKVFEVSTTNAKFSFDLLNRKVAIPSALPGVVGSIDVADLTAPALHALSVAATDASNPALSSLTAVLIDFSPANASVVFEATDRYRMVIRRSVYLPSSQEDSDISVMVPAVELKKLLSDLPKQGDVDIMVNDSYFGISSGDFSGYINLINADPIPYQKMLGQPFNNRFTVQREELKTAVMQVSSMDTKDNRVILTLSNDEIVVSNSENKAEVVVSYATAPSFEEDTYKISYAPSFLAGALASAKSSQISIAFSNPLVKPTILHELNVSGDDDPSYNHIVMPLR